jgi:hypothetical protein
MSLFHAVAFVDHQSAEILQFERTKESPQVFEKHLKQQLQATHQHHSGVRTEHEFFGQVCDAFDGISEVLVVGGHTGLADFRHHVDKHRPAVAPRIVGYEVVDHPTEHQMVALARQFFDQREQMVGIATPR